MGRMPTRDLAGRDFIGFELSEESFAIAQARIEYIQKRMNGDFPTQTESTVKPVKAPLFELMENET